MQCFIDDGTISTAIRDSRTKLSEITLGGDSEVPDKAVRLISMTLFEMLVSDMTQSIQRVHPRFDGVLFKRECRTTLL